VRLGAAVQFARRGRPRLPPEGRVQALVHERAPEAGDRAQPHVERLPDPLIRPTGAGGAGIRLQQDVGMAPDPGRRAARLHQLGQPIPLLLGERDHELRRDNRGRGWNDA
jgi:hypothetical protein